MRAALFSLTVAILVAGCGYKAPLYLPKPKPVAQKPVATSPAPATAPAPPTPAEPAALQQLDPANQ